MQHLVDMPDLPRILVLFGNIPLHGQERANIQVMTCVAEAGADVCFVTNDEYGHESIQPMLDSLGLKWVEARFPRLLGKSWSLTEWLDRFSRIMRYNVAVRRHIREYRPTHIHLANETHLLAALPVLLGIQTPIVFRLGDEPRDHLQIFRWLWRSIYAKRVTRFVCISQFVADRLERLTTRRPDAVIYNLPPDRPLSDKKVSLEPFPGMTFAYIGQLSRQKGVDLLFEAALELCAERSDVRFVFAGDFSWKNDFAKELIGRAQVEGVADRVLFPGFVEDVPEILTAAHVHVCPSIVNEALGNVVVEAKRAGRPSIVFPSGGLPELIEHGVDGYVCASKTQAELARGLRLYLESGRDLARAQGEAARHSLERLGITRSQFTQAWMRVYSL